MPGSESQATAFDIPTRGATGFRPPYGNGSLGIRGYSPPGTRQEPLIRHEPVIRHEPAMMSAEAGSLASGSFGKLADALQQGGKQSIDEIAKELLRPMLKQWLDQNLPGLVETLVREEIERFTRRGGR